MTPFSGTVPARPRVPLLAALVAALMSLVLVAPAPAGAVVVAKTITYDCEADTPLGTETGSSDVLIETTLPARVHKGDKVPARDVTFTIQVPSDLVDTLRDAGTDAVSAVGENANGVPTVFFKVGTLKKPIKNLVVPETPVPAEGPMTIVGTGRAASFTLNETGTYAVKVTAGFKAIVTAHGTIIGDEEAPLSCLVADGESKKLGEIKVVR